VYLVKVAKESQLPRIGLGHPMIPARSVGVISVYFYVTVDEAIVVFRTADCYVLI
jgi:hypothetical protein